MPKNCGSQLGSRTPFQILRLLWNAIKSGGRTGFASIKMYDAEVTKELDEKLWIPVKKGRVVTKTELIRRAIDEFIHNHPELFEK